MSKASKAVTLVLIGSAASLIGYNALRPHGPPGDGTGVSDTGDFGPDDEWPGTQPTTGPAGAAGVRSRTYHSSGTSSTGYHSYRLSSSGYRSSSSGSSSSDYHGSSGSGSSSTSHGTSTSRGGFGSTGHAAASSSS